MLNAYMGERLGPDEVSEVYSHAWLDSTLRLDPRGSLAGLTQVVNALSVGTALTKAYVRCAGGAPRSLSRALDCPNKGFFFKRQPFAVCMGSRLT